MEELAKRFLNKKCIIYTIIGESTNVQGVIKEVNSGAILVECPDGLQGINLEYVTRIREYPRNKKGKEKSFVVD